MSDALSFSGAIATIPLIGRDAPLAQIREAVAPPEARAFRCVLITAEGGIGKTRLLNEVARRLQASTDGQEAPDAEQNTWHFANVVALPLIDVADTTLHTRIPFLRTARSRFANLPGLDDRMFFEAFDATVAASDQAQGTYTPYTEQQRLITQIVETFEAAYRQITHAFRVVWILDTLEQMYFLPPEIDRLFLDSAITDYNREATFAWFVNRFIAGLPENTVVILAGRPRPKLWSEAITTLVQVQTQLRALTADTLPTKKLVDPAKLGRDRAPAERRQDLASAPLASQEQVVLTIELDEFTLQETIRYLEILQGQLARDPAYRRSSRYLRGLLEDRQQCAVLHYLTGGNPIRLAIYLDLLVSGDVTPAEFRQDLTALSSKPEQELDALRIDINAALLRYLTRNLRRPAYQVFEYMALMQRGLDIERLLFVWGAERDEALSVLDHLLRLSFIKRRSWPAASEGTLLPLDRMDVTSVSDAQPRYQRGDRLFLHDELYRSYQQAAAHEVLGTIADTREYQQEVYARLVEFCEARIATLSKTIDHLTREQISLQRQQLDRTEQFQTNKRDLRHALDERRQLRAELLHYSFHFDPRQGFFDTYYDLSDQAFYANDTHLDAQLQSEVEFFFFGIDPELNRTLANMQADEWNILRLAVIYERVAGWVRRLTWLNNFAEAQKFAERALTSHPQEMRAEYPWVDAVRGTPLGQRIEVLYHHDWNVNRYVAALFQGNEVGTAISALLQIAEHLKTLTDEGAPQFLIERRLDLLGRCLKFAGYGHATRREFEQAAALYEHADQVLRAVPGEKRLALKAEVLNDWSRALGELAHGDPHKLADATRKCQEGLEIRKKLGYDYLLGLSYNTMGLIYRVNGNPNQTRHWSGQALELFRQINQPRGIGLALIQLGAATRMIWEQQSEPADPAQIEAYLLEAASIFDPQTGVVPEKVRALDLMIELGRLYIAWSDTLAPPDAAQKRAAAQQSLAAARQLAEEGGFANHLVTINPLLQSL